MGPRAERPVVPDRLAMPLPSRPSSAKWSARCLCARTPRLGVDGHKGAGGRLRWGAGDIDAGPEPHLPMRRRRYGAGNPAPVSDGEGRWWDERAAVAYRATFLAQAASKDRQKAAAQTQKPKAKPNAKPKATSGAKSKTGGMRAAKCVANGKAPAKVGRRGASPTRGASKQGAQAPGRTVDDLAADPAGDGQWAAA